ncbi:hypothetical protein EV702DRAFT_1050663 [Suillus placidus]|uniref:Uncharacterized protein n=1 Tax=Suillus placidus TaxID=48579 RepID=A0A9P6ZHH4_9AGAM|nr:hypothetical protein EV702DRAFT_1050663 [Suillus placidus]
MSFDAHAYHANKSPLVNYAASPKLQPANLAKPSRNDKRPQEYGCDRCDGKNDTIGAKHICLKNSPHGQAAENATKMDEETKNWEIPDEFEKEFEGIKYNFRTERLPVYYEGISIQPTDVNDILNGALVEVEFTI